MPRSRWVPRTPPPAVDLPPWAGRVELGSGRALRPAGASRSWTDVCGPVTSQAAKAAGWQYAAESRVQIVKHVPLSTVAAAGGAYVRAIVQGTGRYSVRLEMDEQSGVCECTCPAFESLGPCKHVFATAIEADRNRTRRAAPSAWAAPPPKREPPAWERRLRSIEAGQATPDAPIPVAEGLTFVLDAVASVSAGRLVLKSARPGPKAGVLKAAPLDFSNLASLDPALEHLARLCSSVSRSLAYSFRMSGESEFSFGPGIDALALRALSECPDPRVRTRDGVRKLRLLPQMLQVVLRLSGDTTTLNLALGFAGMEDAAPPALFLSSGIVVWPDGRCARFHPVASYTLIRNLVREGSLELPRAELPRLVQAFAHDPHITIEAEAATGVRLVETPVPLDADLDLDRESMFIAPRGESNGHGPAWTFDRTRNELKHFLAPSLEPVMASLAASGAKLVSRSKDGAHFRVRTADLTRVGAALKAHDIETHAYDLRIRIADSTSVAVTSGIDWFEVSGEARFGEMTVALQDLLSAADDGAPLIKLADGAWGVLGSDWDTFAALSALGTLTGGKLRFSRPQGAILDHLLREHEVKADETFEKVRRSLRGFDRILPVDAPKGFRGELREYQKEGLSWMGFLAEFGFGGCLADDMGLGKTVQVLALLVARQKQKSAPRKPTLLVVPKSVIFNWKAEALRFAPGITILDYTGTTRPKAELDSRTEDVWLTTYATMRQDIGMLKEIAFSYVILDESQAIKNATSDTAKAVRLLQADHRLALSGTPIENHIGELKSLFDFLNPGLFGSSREMPVALSSGNSQLVARMVRPFLLRRTKAKVAPELPERIEQVIKVKLSPEERAVYNRVLLAARADVLGAVESKGLARSKLHVLTALLRLRQAACHSRLVDGQSLDSGSKVHELIDRLLQLKEEGNRALVFSQFTEFLGIVRKALPPELPHLYLDGKTRDREALVKEFQNASGPPVFLISLKAGGVGLNLTAAGYVFLLDPWWNPAVEAQAIDRAHRIGQRNSVIAYRLVAEDTIEEKILLLQEKKKDLFKSIVSEDGAGDESLLRSLTREDLEAILS